MCIFFFFRIKVVLRLVIRVFFYYIFLRVVVCISVYGVNDFEVILRNFKI